VCLRALWDERALPWGVRGPVECCALARLAATRLGEAALVMLGFSPSELASESVAGWGADGEGVDGKGNIVGRFLSLGNGSCAGECCWVAGRFWGKGKCSDFGVVAFK
jgi:hypothetical protein